MMDQKPRIVLFQCQWCLYSPVDQEWVDHQLPDNMHLSKVPCTGRINTLYILNAVQGGADGVMISGCKPEQCHFKEGNIGARRQLDEFADFLAHIGYDRERVQFSWLDLQDRGRIQRDLASFEADLSALGKTDALATRINLVGARHASPLPDSPPTFVGENALGGHGGPPLPRLLTPRRGEVPPSPTNWNETDGKSDVNVGQND